MQWSTTLKTKATSEITNDQKYKRSTVQVKDMTYHDDVINMEPVTAHKHHVNSKWTHAFIHYLFIVCTHWYYSILPLHHTYIRPRSTTYYNQKMKKKKNRVKKIRSLIINKSAWKPNHFSHREMLFHCHYDNSYSTKIHRLDGAVNDQQSWGENNVIEMKLYLVEYTDTWNTADAESDFVVERESGCATLLYSWNNSRSQLKRQGWYDWLHLRIINHLVIIKVTEIFHGLHKL